MSREAKLTERKRQSGMQSADVGSALTAWPAVHLFFSTELLNKWLPASNKGIFHSSVRNWKQIQVVTLNIQRRQVTPCRPPTPPPPLGKRASRFLWRTRKIFSSLGGACIRDAAVRAHLTSSTLHLWLLLISCELGQNLST